MVTFLTAGPNPSVVTCGGSPDSNSPLLGNCLLLDTEDHAWKAGVIGEFMPSRNTHPAVVTMPVGVYVIGGMTNQKSMELLSAGETHWRVVSELPVIMKAPCAVKISERSFLAIFGKDIFEFDTEWFSQISKDGWSDTNAYPKLRTSRDAWPGCARLGSKVIISGGGWKDGGTSNKPTRINIDGDPIFGTWQSHKSTEILDLTTKTLTSGGDMMEPRRMFHILNLDNKLVAIGGVDNSGWVSGNPSSSSVEEWDPSTSTWSKSETRLSEERATFGAVVVSEELVCRRH